MPLIRVTCSYEMKKEEKQSVIRGLSEKLSQVTGKPVKYMMVIVNPASEMSFGGSFEKSVFIEVKSIGALDPENTKKISKEFCSCISEKLPVPGSRVYIEFTDVPPALWGWDGKTFA